MPAGTINLTNNSATVTGTGTSFSTELKVNDFVASTVGGVAYTLGVKSIESNTSLTLMEIYTGPSATGQSWTPIPYGTMAAITAQLAAQVTYAIRGLNLDKANWQQIFNGTGTVTVNLPDGTSWQGPAWNGIAGTVTGKMDKSQNLNDVANKGTALDNLGALPSAGVTDASNAEVGRVGEYREASNAGVGLASSVFINIAAITLPAGDWDVEGIIQFNTGGATLTSIAVAINSTSSTGPGFPYTTQMPTTNGTLRIPSFKRRYSISSNTVIYLIGLATFSGSGATADGFMRARRVR